MLGKLLAEKTQVMFIISYLFEALRVTISNLPSLSFHVRETEAYKMRKDKVLRLFEKKRLN